MAILQTLLLPLVLAAAALVGDGWLGIRLADAERPTIGEVFPRSPAAKAGLKSGDVIVSINDKATRTVEALFEVFQGLNAGDWARLDVLRGGKKRKFKVQLATRPVEGRQRVRVEEKPARRPGKKPAKVAERDGRPAFLGIEIQESERGLVVTSLVKGAVAARAGIKPGDQLRSFNGARVANIDQLDKIMKGLHARDKIRIGYRRGGRNRETSLVAMARPGARPAAEGRTPARPAPTKRAPTKRAPTKRAPIKRAPVKRAPTKRTAKKTEKAAPKNASMAGFSSSLESSLSKARRRGRPVLLVFGASWCVNCETLKKSLAHSSLRRMLGQYERVWIDTDQQSALADKYNVESLPHTMILSSGGKVQKTIIGYQPAQILAQHLRAGLSSAAPSKRVPSKRAPAKRRSAPKVRPNAQPKKAKVRAKKVQPKKVRPKRVKAQPKKAQPKKAQPKKAQPKKAQPRRVQPRRVRPAPARTAPTRRTAPARNTTATELQRLRSEVQRLRAEQRKQGRLLERILRELQKKK
jgi:thiol-disulfide isomerase/thioredoxin